MRATGASVKLLTNTSGAYLTGDDIADAVLNYGVALANERRVDLVEIPYIVSDDHGAVGSVRMTVGWRAEINATRHQGPERELLDDTVLLELLARTTALHPSGDRPLNPDDMSYFDSGPDY
jgi:hypothetical protein